VSVYRRVTWQLTIMTRDSDNNCFQFNPLFKYLVQFSTQFFKMIQSRPPQFETKLVNKLNYNLYIHVTITFSNIYIKLFHLNI